MRDTAFIRQTIRSSLRVQLKIARARGAAVQEVAKSMHQRLEDLGMRYGFLPDDPPTIANDLSVATVEVMCADYRTELIVTV